MSDTHINPTATEGGLTIPEESGATASRQEAKTFTQADLDRIVQERLARSKAELQAEREKSARQAYEQSAREVLKQKGLSEQLLTALNVSDLDGLNAALDILDQEFHFSNPNQCYLQNADGTMRKAQPGEVNIPPMGRVDMGTDGGIRAAMGLLHK